jgi:general stress protein 26
MAEQSTEMKADSKQERMTEFQELIDKFDLAMLVTHAEDGSIVSRLMATQQRRDDVDMWFVTNIDDGKVAEIETYPEVNVSYVNNSSREWVSVSGIGTINTDREVIASVYKPDWKAWFPDEGGDRNGGPNDPRIALIEVDAHRVTYFKSTDSRPVALFKVLRAMATGSTPDLGETKTVTR